jgi:hypothetical protein
VIHNAGIGYREPERVETQDGVPEVFATNVLAPFGGSSISAPERTTTPSPIWKTLPGRAGAGQAPPLMPKANFTTWSWLSPPPAFGLTYSLMR